jgi:hypothetical protein
MKNILLRLSLLLSLAFVFSSCDPFPDPPQPNYEEELKQLLPAVQYISGYYTGTDHSRFQLQWSQQLAGVRGVHLTVDTYNMMPVHTQETWDFYYLTTYPNINLIIQHSNEINAPAYRGIARVMLALNLGWITDAWGDAPNQLALNYFQGLFAGYDDQSDIYIYLMEQLDLAVMDIDQAMAGVGLIPGAQEDLIYGGDFQKWIKAAHALKLRFLMRIAHQQNNYELVRLNIFPPVLFSGNQDDMKYQFIDNQRNIFHYYETEVRNTRMGKFFVDKLLETNDPRLPVFVRRSTANNEYVGSAPGQANFNASFIGTQIVSQQSPAFFMTYVEQKFIEAEVLQRAGEQSAADLAFELAVKASLQKHGVSNPAWEAQHAEVENVSLEQIINAKYIALFLNPEVWSDFRRTGYPQLTPYQDAETPQIPRRFLYPATEISSNTQNVPPNVTIYTRMWWDVGR